MNMNIFVAAAVMFLALPFAARAQSVMSGVAEGAHEGDRAAGPVGAIVGGAVDTVGGGASGLPGADQQPRFRAYGAHEHRPSYAYGRPVAVGSELPGDGATYSEVSMQYGVRNYHYAIVNERTVLVDPKTHRIVEVIE
jgi:hypothetical protein